MSGEAEDRDSLLSSPDVTLEEGLNGSLLSGDEKKDRSISLANLDEFDLHDYKRRVKNVIVTTSTSASNRANILFKTYVIMSMVTLWTGYTIMVRYTRSTTPDSQLYASSSVVFLAEFLKLLVTMFFLFRESNFSKEQVSQVLRTEYFGKPFELAKMSVPSIAYAIQNNLDFIALSNLEAGVYQVTSQLKIVSTAIFMMFFLGRNFSIRRWVAIFLLFGGVAAVQMDKLEQSTVPVVESHSKIASEKRSENALLGLAAVLFTCATAGFAGVWFEKMLKDGSKTSFWIRNLQMYSCGLVSTMIGCVLSEPSQLWQKGFFHGYNFIVVMIVVFLSLGGIYISLVMKYMDNLHKSFASSVSIILVVVLSVMLFNDVHVGRMFILGSTTVCFAVVLYNSVNE
ncbi:nucleotide-sugar transporter domain-containing protein [Ditylenchus destructor]|nr:nucleotide-sugar transporter domain-containing protein [Ditylenchus destructor]